MLGIACTRGTETAPRKFPVIPPEEHSSERGSREAPAECAKEREISKSSKPVESRRRRYSGACWSEGTARINARLVRTSYSTAKRGRLFSFEPALGAGTHVGFEPDSSQDKP